MTYFIDNNLSFKLAEGLRGFGEEVTHLRDEFQPDTPDEEWIPEIGRRGYYLISRDVNIARRDALRGLLVGAGLGAFFFTQKKRYAYWDWVEAIIRRWRSIEDWRKGNAPPFVVGIPERGSLRRL